MATGSRKAAETRRLLETGAWLSVTVDGDCMSPTFRRGDVVLVRRGRAPRPGDVALLDAQGWLEIHRLVARVDVGPRRWYVHLGDGASLCGVAGPRDILGVVETRAPRRPAPAPRAHLTALFLRLGALLDFLGLGRPRRCPGS
jgi:hypothetical protein